MELELKLEFDPADRDRLASAPALTAVEGATEHLVSTYFDTPDGDLEKAGYTLRVRRNGRRRIQTVKASRGGAAGLFRRDEWERPVKSDAPEPGAAGGRLAEAVGASALGRIAPVFVSDIERTSMAMDCDGSRFELAIDQGEVRAGNRSDPVNEIELELRNGSAQGLFDLARQLNERMPLRLGVRSKSERGQALLAGVAPGPSKAEPIMLDREGDASDAFRAIAFACLRHFRLNEPLLLETGDAEALHQARVALRRLRSAFSIHKALFEGDGSAALLAAEARWLAAELGEVRNLDVLIGRFDGKVRERLTAARTGTFDHVRTEVDSARTRLMMIDLVAWLETGSWRTRSADPTCVHQQVLPFSRDLLDDRRQRLERRGLKLAKLDDAHRHKVRIEAKKLRYAAEFFASLHPSKRARRRQERLVEALKALQDTLGELNDLAVSTDVLARHGIDAEPPHGEGRKRLVAKAEKAFAKAVRVKPFWKDD